MNSQDHRAVQKSKKSEICQFSLFISSPNAWIILQFAEYNNWITVHVKNIYDGSDMNNRDHRAVQKSKKSEFCQFLLLKHEICLILLFISSANEEKEQNKMLNIEVQFI